MKIDKTLSATEFVFGPEPLAQTPQSCMRGILKLPKVVVQTLALLLQSSCKKMDFLDIGGGFSLASDQPTSSEKKFDKVAVMIQSVLQEVFPEPHIRIIGEPGRYVSEGVAYLAS